MERRFPSQLTTAIEQLLNHRRMRRRLRGILQHRAAGSSGIAGDIESIFGGKRQRAATQRKARDKPGTGGCHACTMFISHGSLFRLTMTSEGRMYKKQTELNLR
jgi:hypothetical protein